MNLKIGGEMWNCVPCRGSFCLWNWRLVSLNLCKVSLVLTKEHTWSACWQKYLKVFISTMLDWRNLTTLNVIIMVKKIRIWCRSFVFPWAFYFSHQVQFLLKTLNVFWTLQLSSLLLFAATFGETLACHSFLWKCEMPRT